MAFEHIMLDLETLSSGPRALILSIGAVRFDLESFQLGEEFYQVVDGADCQRLGLETDFETVRWWMQQNAQAQNIFQSSGVSLALALQRFTDFACFVEGAAFDSKLSIIWGNGATFDNIILRNAYRVCGLSYPVSYRNDFCYRTIRKMFPCDKLETGIAHNALDDAKSQALTLIEIMKKMKA